VQPDAALVALERLALDEALLLEPGDRLRARCGGDSLRRGEVADADPGGVLDRHEERDLAAGDAERVNLPAELSGQPQERRPEPVGDLDFVNQGNVHLVNDSGSALTPRAEARARC
jgi:hypothetical protein